MGDSLRLLPSTNMEPCLPIPLPQEKLTDLVEKGKDFCLMHGICMRQKNKYDRDALHFAPFVLLPSPFPKDEYYKAIQLQTILNELMHKVAHDYDFLKTALKNTIKVDEFTGKLWDIYETICQEGGPSQGVEVGLFRSDYFFCCANYCIKQVEFNTIASSFGCTTSRLVKAHKYIVGEAGYGHVAKQIPENKALEGLAGALVEAWKIYDVPESVILFLVEDVTYNICDQKFHEFEIRNQCPEVFVIRKTLTDLAQRGSLTEDKRLMIDGKEVAVIYMRCGYHPDQSPTQAEWDARLMMERSLAVKSPSINYHLAGTKKVQQELARPGQVEKFLGDKVQIEAVKEIFTGLYSLDHDEIGDSNLARAIASPQSYVLKPQREGGGNNVYGDQEKIITNKQVGHMLRTKLSHVDEGGVSAGLGALDSLYLVEEGSCCPVKVK